MRQIKIIALDKAVKAGVDVSPFIYEWATGVYYDIPICLSDLKIGSAVELHYQEIMISITTHDGDYLVCGYDLRNCDGAYEEMVFCESTTTLAALPITVIQVFSKTAEIMNIY